MSASQHSMLLTPLQLPHSFRLSYSIVRRHKHSRESPDCRLKTPEPTMRISGPEATDRSNSRDVVADAMELLRLGDLEAVDTLVNM